jgi:hypothetical protein
MIADRHSAGLVMRALPDAMAHDPQIDEALRVRDGVDGGALVAPEDREIIGWKHLQVDDTPVRLGRD